MERLLGSCADAAAGSAALVARAAETERRRLGLVEAPGVLSDRAAEIREGLRRLHRDATPDDAREVLALAQEILRGAWSAVVGDVSGVYADRGVFARRGGAWAWGVLGRSLGIEVCGAQPHT